MASPAVITVLISSLLYSLSFSTAAAATFRCNSTTTCDAIVDYVLPNTTTLNHIKNLFNLKNLRSILGANNLPLTTPPNFTLPATTAVKIPFPCLCTNGTGKSNKRPMYTVVKDDGLYHIAAKVFSGLVTFQEIQAANNISDANLITVGQKLWIPLPCSCDDVDGQRVVHYGHVVPAQSTIEGIAEEFGTSQDTLLRLNGLASPRDLKADSILDVPLKACTSMVRNDSLDNPLLVANGTYVFTAANCVMCKCDAANNWTLQCEPTQLNSSLWQSCPSTQCQGAQLMSLGNSTSAGCNRTSCTYAGYTNQTILTTLVPESTCPASQDNSSAIALQSWRWSSLWILFHLFLLSINKFL
ncbi:hypothetical protein M9H77_33724 [Catharanthus roseus]|uniref:Uncharacterized protein n=1 Tax=Catharanthus roseus TaxID=4058 RepID=A0ACB9ZJ91_CATRO|nr:hypothetical protein M9H77_33724 [Catharanthus roseus]